MLKCISETVKTGYTKAAATAACRSALLIGDQIFGTDLYRYEIDCKYNTVTLLSGMATWPWDASSGVYCISVGV